MKICVLNNQKEFTIINNRLIVDNLALNQQTNHNKIFHFTFNQENKNPKVA